MKARVERKKKKKNFKGVSCLRVHFSGDVTAASNGAPRREQEGV